MADASSSAKALLEEGLQLYQEGQLDMAIARWRLALRHVPGLRRAAEYIQYIEQNREALERSFAARGAAVRPPTMPDAESDPGDVPEVMDWREVDPDAEAGMQSGPARGRSPTRWPPGAEGSQIRDDDLTPRVDLPHEIPELLRASPGPRKGSRTAGGLPALQGISNKRTPDSLSSIDGDARDDFDDEAITAARPKGTVFGVGVAAASVVPGGPSRRGATAAEPGARPAQPPPTGTSMARSEGARGTNLSRADAAADVAPDDLDGMLRGARQLYEQGTYESSLWFCERILAIDKHHRAAQELLKRTQAALVRDYRRQLVDVNQVPVVRLPQSEIRWHKLDHRAGFVLSRIDGMLTYSDIIDISGMSAFEVHRILAQLLKQGVIGPSR